MKNCYVKPSFVAPSQPLEKSLKEHIQRTSGLVSSPQQGRKDQKAKKKKEKRKSKESSPPIIVGNSKQCIIYFQKAFILRNAQCCPKRIDKSKRDRSS